jgi:hypothetical protein
VDRIVNRLVPHNVSYQFGECKFIFVLLSVQGSHFPDFLPDGIAELPGFEHLDGASVFQDLPGDFDESRDGETQAQASVLPDGDLLGLVPFLFGDPGRDAGRKTQHHVRGVFASDDAEIPPEVFLDRREGERCGAGLHGADARKGEVPHLPPQAAKGDQVPVSHVTQEVQGPDDTLRRLVLVRGVVGDLQGAGAEQGADDGMKDGLRDPGVRDVLDRHLFLHVPDAGRGVGGTQREEVLHEAVQGFLEVPVGDGGGEPQGQAEGVKLLLLEPDGRQFVVPVLVRVAPAVGIVEKGGAEALPHELHIALRLFAADLELRRQVRGVREAAGLYAAVEPGVALVGEFLRHAFSSLVGSSKEHS